MAVDARYRDKDGVISRACGNTLIGWAQWRQSMTKISALAAVLFIGTVVTGPAALAQTTGTPNSGAGVQGLPGNKSGSAAKPEQNPSGQSSGVSQDQSKVPGLRGNKSGPAPEKASK